MSKINYKVILTQCLNGLRDPDRIEPLLKQAARSYIDEFRTIGIITPRQTGSSLFLTDIINEGHGIIICRADDEKKQLLKTVLPKYSDRVLLAHKVNISDILYEFKDKDIQFICLDDHQFFNLRREVYNKLIEVFGERLVVIKT